MIDSELKLAVEVLSMGGIILYPTDTIWGIGCDATKGESVQKIYKLKQRNDSKSMLVLVNEVKMLNDYLSEIPSQALELISNALKPTTIIYPGARKLAENLLAEDGSVGIRITSDPFCKALIERTGKPIVSTSANLSGEPSPSLYREINPLICQKVDHVVNWRQDETKSTLPSSIIKLESDGHISILRP